MSKKYKLSACQLRNKSGVLVATVNQRKGELIPAINKIIAIFDRFPRFPVKLWNAYALCKNKSQLNVTYHLVCTANDELFRNANGEFFGINGELKPAIKREFIRAIKLCIYSMGYSPNNYHTVAASESLESIAALKQWRLINGDCASMPVLENGITLSVCGGSTNELVRYWHDLIHLEINAGFSLHDEMRVTNEHIRQLSAVDSKYTKLFTDIINADIGGQAIYYDINNRFIVNGVRFVHNFLYEPENTIINFNEGM